jgi:fluoride exporter
MRLLILATAGGAIGAGARHLVNVAFARWIGGDYPWATLTVNVVGSALMGFLIAMIMLKFDGSIALRAFLATGILGGFTTFSAFSFDVFGLMERGETVLALGYIALSVIGSIAALMLGFAFARGLFA